MTRENNHRVSIKVSRSLLDSLKDAQYEARKATGREPTYLELLEAAWQAYRNQTTQQGAPDA